MTLWRAHTGTKAQHSLLIQSSWTNLMSFMSITWVEIFLQHLRDAISWKPISTGRSWHQSVLVGAQTGHWSASGSTGLCLLVWTWISTNPATCECTIRDFPFCLSMNLDAQVTCCNTNSWMSLLFFSIMQTEFTSTNINDEDYLTWALAAVCLGRSLCCVSQRNNQDCGERQSSTQEIHQVKIVHHLCREPDIRRHHWAFHHYLTNVTIFKKTFFYL